MAREEPIAFIFKTLLAQVSTNVILKCGNKLLFVKKMAVTWTSCHGGVMPLPYRAALYNYSHYKPHFHYCHHTANLGIPLGLKQIAFKCQNTEFNPCRHGAVVMKLMVIS
jgi:hypothetical protein